MAEPLGIENFGPWYVRVKQGDNPLIELLEIDDFIYDVINREYISEFKGEKQVEFINYGGTQLIFVLSVDDKKYTLVVNQPQTKMGTSKKEFENLVYLSGKNSNVINPLYYFNSDKRELYVTPYRYQARCLGSEINKWGMWLPEPYYHFIEFDNVTRFNVLTAMIATMIRLYDEESGKGIIQTKLDGGDFMLYKGAERDMTTNNILENIELIACRDMLEIDLEGYINLIRNELTGKSNDYIFLTKYLRSKISEEEVEAGIELGRELRKKKKEKSLK